MLWDSGAAASTNVVNSRRLMGLGLADHSIERAPRMRPVDEDVLSTDVSARDVMAITRMRFAIRLVAARHGRLVESTPWGVLIVELSLQKVSPQQLLLWQSSSQ
jgi:hypothetical protein